MIIFFIYINIKKRGRRYLNIEKLVLVCINSFVNIKKKKDINKSYYLYCKSTWNILMLKH